MFHKGSDAGGCQDGLLWYKDSGQHLNGEFSMAVVQANNLLEDQSQIESGSLSVDETGPYGTFIGVYDGHGGLRHLTISRITCLSISRVSGSTSMEYYGLKYVIYLFILTSESDLYSFGANTVPSLIALYLASENIVGNKIYDGRLG